LVLSVEAAPLAAAAVSDVEVALAGFGLAEDVVVDLRAGSIEGLTRGLAAGVGDTRAFWCFTVAPVSEGAAVVVESTVAAAGTVVSVVAAPVVTPALVSRLAARSEPPEHPRSKMNAPTTNDAVFRAVVETNMCLSLPDGIMLALLSLKDSPFDPRNPL
jgi:hypothetical protein